MMNERQAKKKISRIYRKHDGKLTSSRFFRELSEGYRYSLRNTSDGDGILSVQPAGAKLKKLLRKRHYVDLSYDLEKVVENVAYSLMCYGKAYIYINADYSVEKNRRGKPCKVLQSLEIGEIKGVVSKRTNTSVEFWGFGPLGNISKKTYNSSGFVEVRLKEFGYTKHYFVKLARKLDRCDITASTRLLNTTDGYDFSAHMKKNNEQEFEITKDLGWIPSFDGISESQLLFRRIQQNKFKTSMLRFVVDRINQGLKSFIDLDSDGILNVSLKDVDYDELWEKYSSGLITSTELASFVR